jgi:hypothetical protein
MLFVLPIGEYKTYPGKPGRIFVSLGQGLLFYGFSPEDSAKMAETREPLDAKGLLLCKKKE